MTETTRDTQSDPITAGPRASGRGLSIERVYTTPGVHPYDEVTWERRDVVMTNWRDGTINFEQRGVEFPEFWSVNAANIVTTKYFRGAVGTEQREWSLKQLIDRVVLTYVKAGQVNGYFATVDDATIFEHELTYALMHQVFSFNSPVWFNVGTSAPQQVSACFILAVDDKMDSILDWYKEEGMIFKGGSGSGVNLSRIRSSKELLSSGGTASGPVSFMRGADASAGTIKSGGATRRAAKMVILDVDHPDIEEFIDTKAREEDKIRVLRDAGYDMDLGGRDMSSVQYQNANNSVRVNEEFMRAFEQGKEFGLKARTDGSVIETVDAKKLMRSMAQAAWECADPGIQYDDTINDWHTTPETGRITASNPCFPADQRVVTDKGLIRIGDLVSRAATGETFSVYTNDVTAEHDAEARVVATNPTRYMVTGTNEILELRFSDGSRLRCTPGHRLWTSNRGWVHAEELQTDDRVVRSFHEAMRPMASLQLPDVAVKVAQRAVKLNLPQKWDDEFAHFLGTLLVGGATETSTYAHLSRDGRDGIKFLEALGVSRVSATNVVVPQAVFEAPDDAVKAFLCGLFDVAGLNIEGSDLHASAQSEELLLGVQELLASLGIASQLVESGASFDLRASGASADDIDEAVTLVSRESRGFETTYNLTEPRNHSYIVSGVVVANCSEYMHLDNSSCNLASLNLMKFLKDDDSFDAVTFAKVVEFVITAMDISICFADFPTEKIGDTTRKFRQLGIGYANLGALLMATGHAYDSDSGRALAAGITSLMTGTAYKRSAELAGIVGPYEGYARNAEAHTRVMRKHAAASDSIRSVGIIDREVIRLASKAWQDGLKVGTDNGWRNAQASVLAPTGTIGLMMDCDTTGIEPDLALVKFKKLVGGGSMQIVNQTVPRALRNLGYQEEQVEAIVEYIAEHGNPVDAPGLRPEHYEVFDCAMGVRSISAMGHVRMMAAVQPFISGAISKCVTGETLLATADGLIRIDSLHRGELADSFRDEILEVASLTGPQKTDAFYYGGERDVREVVLRSGHKVTGTPNHRLLVATDEGLDWRYLGDIAEGTYVAVQYGTDMWSKLPARFDDFVPAALHGSQKTIRIPSEMTEELALLLGAFAAEGHITRSTHTVVVTNSVESVLERVALAWETYFGLAARITRDPGKCPGVVVSSKTLVEFLDHLGMGGRSSEKRIPDAVLRSPRQVVLAFLQGLALDAYVHVGDYTKWAICLDAPRLLDDLQAVLTNLGIVHSRISKYNKEYDKYYDEVFACGEEARTISLLVPFLEPDKAERAAPLVVMNFNQSTADVVPGLTGRDLYAAIPAGKSGHKGNGPRHEFTFLLDPRTKAVSRRTVERVAAIPGVVLPQWVYDMLWDGLHFSPVVKVADAGSREVYDVSVPTNHAFVGNGIVNHNTVNLPETASVEDVEEVYYEGWKLGLKALAIYRNNCKVGQPLSDAREKKTDVGVAVSGEYKPVRKRLPKRRPSQTVSFAVAGAEGYLTAGSYPDDGLGEVFLKLGKQGSTLAGVMDAFSIAISIALQYGVPLEAFVSKFVNMRFDPAGLTDDQDVRMAQSIMDYIFRRLALDYLPFDTRAELGIFTADERAQTVASKYGDDPGAPVIDDDLEYVDSISQSAPIEKPSTVTLAEVASAKPVDADVHSSTELLERQLGTAADAPLCMGCGTKMRPAGSCYVCEGCGSTSGCS